jgi:hypothetical protein
MQNYAKQNNKEKLCLKLEIKLLFMGKNNVLGLFSHF